MNDRPNENTPVVVERVSDRMIVKWWPPVRVSAGNGIEPIYTYRDGDSICDVYTHENFQELTKRICEWTTKYSSKNKRSLQIAGILAEE